MALYYSAVPILFLLRSCSCLFVSSFTLDLSLFLSLHRSSPFIVITICVLLSFFLFFLSVCLSPFLSFLSCFRWFFSFLSFLFSFIHFFFLSVHIYRYLFTSLFLSFSLFLSLSLFFICFLIAPEGRRFQYSAPCFSPAPRTSFLSETGVSPNVPRDGPVEIPSTEELYRALSLNTDKSQMISEFNELVYLHKV